VESVLVQAERPASNFYRNAGLLALCMITAESGGVLSPARVQLAHKDQFFSILQRCSLMFVAFSWKGRFPMSVHLVNPSDNSFATASLRPGGCLSSPRPLRAPPEIRFLWMNLWSRLCPKHPAGRYCRHQCAYGQCPARLSGGANGTPAGRLGDLWRHSRYALS